MKHKANKPLFVWRAFVNHALPFPASGSYGSLSIEIQLAYKATDPYQLAKPVPVYPTSWGSKETLEFKFQSSFQRDPEEPTSWYGGRLNFHSENIGGKSVILPWFQRLLPEPIGTGNDAVQTLWDALAKNAKRVAYSCVLNEFVDAFSWEKAESYRTYIDTGITRRGSEGCIINAYAPIDASNEVITHAISKALRESPHCSDAQFAEWITAGSLWKPAYHSGNLHHRPLDINEILHPHKNKDQSAA